jgi:TetR/AcrR family transcriptional repressor of mexJK operon
MHRAVAPAAAKSALRESSGVKSGRQSQRRGRPKVSDAKELDARIVSFATQTFYAKGYGAASMAMVARAARVSRTTLYARFPNKAELFRAIVETQIATIENPFSQSVAGDLTLEARLFTYADRMLGVSLHGDTRQLNRLIYSEYDRFPELGRTARARSTIGVRQVAACLRESEAAHGRKLRNPEGAAEVFIMMLKGWYLEAMLTKRVVKDAERKAWAKKVATMFLASRADW